jgi:transposase InsO family protein
MPKKRYTPEEIIQHLRTVELDTGKGLAVLDSAGSSASPSKDARSALNGELFYTLKEAQIIIERWRIHYNTVRPHSSLGASHPLPKLSSLRAED